MRVLQDIATANGVAIPNGYTLSDVMAASTDGSILLGTALDDSPNPKAKAFVLELPVSAYGIK